MCADEINLTVKENVGVLEISGDFAADTAGALPARVSELAARGLEGFAFDLSRVEYIDSSGISVLLEIKKLLAGVGEKMALFGLPDPIYKVFERMQLETAFKIVRSEARAIEKIKEK